MKNCGNCEKFYELFLFKGMYILGVYVSKECNEIYGFILFVKDMKRNE